MITNGVGTATPIEGNFATLQTNVQTGSTNGLRLASDFTVEGTFDLINPAELRQEYGIRLTDRIGTVLGNDTLDLVVRNANTGVVAVQLRHLDQAGNVSATLQSITLNPTAQEDHILLRLSHAANSSAITASFDLYAGGAYSRTISFTTTDDIFHGEDFTRASFFAAAPNPSVSYLNGNYGTLSIDSTGEWSYSLNNGSSAVQSLSENQTVHDIFTVDAADGHPGGVGQRTVDVSVVGVNDAPLVRAASGDSTGTATPLPETNLGLSASGTSTVNDPDLNDTVTLSVSQVSVTGPTGGIAIPQGSNLDAVLKGFFSVTAGPLAANPSDLHNVSWSFNSGSEAFNYLAAGDTLTLTYTIRPADGHTPTGTGDGTVTIRIAGTNDAPTIDAATLEAVAEDTAGPLGQKVSTIFFGKFHDIDNGSSFAGIAVVANHATPDQGVWQYKSSPQGLWEDIGTASESEALAFDANTLLRFVPAADFNGTPGGLEVRGLDDTYNKEFTIGQGGGGRYTINTTNDGDDPLGHGGTTAISDLAVTLSTTVTAVNNAPDSSAGLVQPGLVNGSFENGYDPSSFSTVYPASDPGFIPGWTVIGQNVDVVGSNWVASDGARSIDLNGDQTGGLSQVITTVAGVLYTVHFDLSGLEFPTNPHRVHVSAAGTSQDYALDSTGHTNGNMMWTPETFTFVATGTSTTLTFASADGGSSGPALDNVKINATGFGNTEGNVVAIQLRGSDGDGTVASFRITQLAANGALYSSADLAPNHVIALNDLVAAAGNAATVYFKPDLNWNGTTSLSFAAVDNNGLADASPASIAIVISPVNDAPVASGSSSLAAIDEDVSSPSGATVNSLFGANFSDAADQVAGGSSSNLLAGIAISGYTINASRGMWEYSTDGGSHWSALGNTSGAAAITLAVADMIRFVPATNYNGPATPLSAHLIESGQSIVSGAAVNLSGIVGGATHISFDGVALNHTINPLNAAPVVTAQAAGNHVLSSSGGDVPGRAAYQGVQASGLGISGDSSVTVEFWLKDGTEPTSMAVGFFEYDLLIGNNSDGTSAIGFNTGQADLAYVLRSDLQNQWHHITAVFVTGNVQASKLYIDGVLQTLQPSFPNNALAVPSDTFHIGGWGVSTQYALAGQIDDVSVWHGERTQTEITADIQGNITGPQPGLVASYSFENVSSGTGGVIDSSGNGHNGTLSTLTTANVIADSTVRAHINEDHVLVFSNANHNGISVSDSDSSQLTVTLTVSHGLLTVTASGLTVSYDNGITTLSGSTANINAALEGLSYQPDLNYNGADALVVTVSDGTLSHTRTIDIAINPVNDAPVITLTGTLIDTDFSSVPAGTNVTIFGGVQDGYPSPAGGHVVNGTLELTADVAGSSGAIVVRPDAAPSDFHATFHVSIGGGSTRPADGFQLQLWIGHPDQRLCAMGECRGRTQAGRGKRHRTRRADGRLRDLHLE